MFFEIKNGKLAIWIENGNKGFIERFKIAIKLIFNKAPPFTYIELRKDESAWALQSVIDEWLDDTE